METQANQKVRKIIDIESSNLLQNGLDYLTLPFKLKPTYSLWCIVVRCIDTNTVIELRPDLCTKEALKEAIGDADEIVGHNIVCFDLPVLKLMGLLDYRIGYPGQPHTVYSKEVEITDTLLWSKLLNADRFGGHSLAAWGQRLGNYKGDFNDWSKFSEEMLEYCVQDTAVNRSIYFALEKERGSWSWSKAYSCEIKLADLILRQELFGFDFNIDLANKNVEVLTKLMQDIAAEVDPILPPKQMTKGKQDFYTMPVKRIKADGKPTSYLLKFVKTIDADLDQVNELIIFEGKEFPLDFQGPLKATEPATIEDIDTVKGYLLGLGWEPSEIKERDLVKNTNKTTKEYQQIVESIDRYVKQTSTSVFKDLRCAMLGVEFSQLRKSLMLRIDGTKPIYVPTAPKLTVGVEKEICPNLVALGEKAAFVKKVVEYYTYRHRKNSIAGGYADEEDEPSTGFLSCIREDGRIPTPADTLGANTGRFRHKIVCNIPRVTSLFGEQMRGMFGCGKGFYQLGYDFASLEARIMGHYVMQYQDGEALAEALVAEKPNDIHSINARKLGIDRSSAKSFSYAAIYGAQPKKLAKMLNVSEERAKQLFNEYWDAVPALKQLKEKVEEYWTKNGKTHIPGLDGRKLSTRSKHSLINVLFQSGGAIAAKWSSLRMAQRMEELGILGDPFLHSKTEAKVWYMIHMHDEAQMAVHPSLMKVKSFATEDEAKAFKADTCSAVGHGSKGFYVGLKTQPVQCIAEGIAWACQELKLKVDLGFEWIPGVSWAQCH